MNIAIVCYPTFGGSGVVATELGLALGKRGHNIHFITYNLPVRLEALNDSKIYFHEVNVPDYPLFKYQPYELALSSRLVDVIKSNKIDLLHVHYAIPHAYAAYMAKKMLFDIGIEIPIVTTLHGTDITLVGSHPFYRPAVTFSINHSDRVTAVSKSLKEDTLNLFDIKNQNKMNVCYYQNNKWNPLYTVRDETKVISAEIKRGSIIGVIIDDKIPEIDNVVPRNNATYNLGDMENFEIYLKDNFSGINYDNGINLTVNEKNILTGYNIYQKKILTVRLKDYLKIGKNTYRLTVSDNSNNTKTINGNFYIKE